ncbi:tetraspanin-33 isoform X2 [Hypomesus transpacificus]|uniref:tetraspanin-33 isoform X2 n=1 Tax=Hypomesus transpacificus TaxID=137520 RepID=UPI001F0805D9|nr:tetraspanin-33 isoform X2 [Hypomesus transpacificus]
MHQFLRQAKTCQDVLSKNSGERKFRRGKVLLDKFCERMKGYRRIKYSLFACCYMFSVTSTVLVAVGIYSKIAKEKDVVDTLTIDPALLLIIVGSLMLLITFFGCFGALRNGTWLLRMFLGILVAILLLQIVAAVLGFVFSDMVLERTEKLMRKAIIRYREDLDLENVIDFVQKKLQCCGVHSYKDWSYNIYFECLDGNPSQEACGVPFSCCLQLRNETIFNTMCGYKVQDLEETTAQGRVYTTGCLDRIVWWGKRNLFLVGGLTGGLLLLETPPSTTYSSNPASSCLESTDLTIITLCLATINLVHIPISI